MGGGVEFLVVKRLESFEPSANLGYLNTNDNIFHGDILEVSAGPSPQFELNPYTTKYSVSSDLNIQATAKQVLFNVEIRAMYNGEIISSEIKYNVGIGTTVSSAATYGWTYNLGDYVYSNPTYTSQTITTNGVVLITNYKTRVNPKTIPPQLSYTYEGEDESYERYYFELSIYDPGKIGGRVFLCKTDNSTIDAYEMNIRQKYVGNLDSNYEFLYSVETTYSDPDKYIHVRISRGNVYTEISTIHIQA